MKKFVLPLFSCLLVLSLLLGSFVTAKAAPGDDPVVTPVSGDTDFTTEVVAIASLPGTVTLDDGMLAPLGFPAGEAQFGGNGVRVTAMDQGKATACFSLSASAVNEGWGGKVAVWNGAKWVRLATSITTADETNTALACATITGSGTYAFIKYVAEPDKLPGYGKCTDEPVVSPAFGWNYSTGTFVLSNALIVHSPAAPDGTTVSFQLLSVSPEGLLPSGPYSGSGTVIGSNPGIFIVAPSSPIVFHFDKSLVHDLFDVSVVARVFLPDCYIDVTFPNDFLH
jgi:hypothetical protein